MIKDVGAKCVLAEKNTVQLHAIAILRKINGRQHNIEELHNIFKKLF